MNEITKLKTRLKWSTQQIADWLGISRQAVWQLETGKTNPSNAVKKSIERLWDHLEDIS